MTDSELHDAEIIGCTGESLECQLVAKLVSHVRHLQHQLNDPNYLYSGRIHRQAIISRDAKIDRLLAQIEQLRGE